MRALDEVAGELLGRVLTAAEGTGGASQVVQRCVNGLLVTVSAQGSRHPGWCDGGEPVSVVRRPARSAGEAEHRSAPSSEPLKGEWERETFDALGPLVRAVNRLTSTCKALRAERDELQEQVNVGAVEAVRLAQEVDALADDNEATTKALAEAQATVRLMTGEAADAIRDRDAANATADDLRKLLQRESASLAGARATLEVSERIGAEKARRLTIAKAALAHAIGFAPHSDGAERDRNEAYALLCQPFTKDERDGFEASLPPFVPPWKPEPLDDSDVKLSVSCDGSHVKTSTTLREFLEANAEPEDEHVRGKVQALKPGESVTLGGGASCCFTVEREA